MKTAQNPIVLSFIGKNKSAILQQLLRLNLNYTEFVHWLAIPKLGILLKFDKQICQSSQTLPPSL